jgi:hypothetical protein
LECTLLGKFSKDARVLIARYCTTVSNGDDKLDGRCNACLSQDHLAERTKMRTTKQLSILMGLCALVVTAEAQLITPNNPNVLGNPNALRSPGAGSIGIGAAGGSASGNNSFGATPATGFGTPLTNNFGRTPTTGYGTAPGSGLGSTPTTGLGTTSTNGLGTLSSPSYSTTLTNNFGPVPNNMPGALP